MELLLGKSAKIDAVDRDRNTSLHLAVRSGYTATVNLLLERGTSVQAFAAMYGHTRVVELLLKKHALIDPRGGGGLKKKQLHFATRNGHAKVVELLLGKGAMIGVMNEDIPYCTASCNTEWLY